MTDSRFIRLGVLSRPHALEGGLRCMLDNPSVPAISVPCTVKVGFSESYAQDRTLVRYEAGRGEVVCFFQGVDTREKAMELMDQALFIEPDLLSYEKPYADPGLIGFEIRDEDDRLLGTVAGMLLTNAHYIWRVEEEGREWMLPAIEEFVLGIDEEAQVIVVRLIPGLYDDDQEVAEDEGGG